MWEAIGGFFKAGGREAVLSIVTIGAFAGCIYFAFIGTSDRFTATRWENEKTLIDIQLSTLANAVKGNSSAVRQNTEEIEKLRVSLNKEVSAINAGLREASEKATEHLIQQVKIREALGQLILRSDEDRKAQADFRAAIQNLAERIVKAETYIDGQKGKR